MNGFDSYAEWLGISPARRPPNHYELLGLRTGEGDAALVRAAGKERSARVRRYCLGRHGQEATRLLGELAAAFACLSDPAAKAAYDRQLFDDAAGGPPADVSPPPIQHRVEVPHEEAPARRQTAVVKKVPAADRSWIRRRREVLSSAPARYTFAAALLLAATCGAVWSVRRLPPEHARAKKNVPQTSLAAAPRVDKPLPGSWHPQSPGSTDAAVPPARADSVTVDAVTADAETAEEVPPKDDAPPVNSPGDADVGAHVMSPAPPIPAPDAAVAPKEPSPAPDQTSGPPLAASGFLDKAQGREAASGKSNDATEEDRQARVLRPRSMWRLSTGDDPEWLEVTFDDPVDAAHIELAEPSSPAMIDRAVIESADGSRAEIKPVLVFYHEGIRRWSFGSTRRPQSTRFLLRFRPTPDGVVDLTGVAVLDRMGGLHFPVLVRAVTEGGDGARPSGATTNKPAPAKEAEPPEK